MATLVNTFVFIFSPYFDYRQVAATDVIQQYYRPRLLTLQKLYGFSLLVKKEIFSNPIFFV